MNIILLQARLSLQEIELLLKEFPLYLFLTLSENSYKNLTPDYWARVEVLYGSRLTVEELHMAHQIRWIHCPFPHLNRLCMEEIAKQPNLMVTNTLDENVYQVGEFVMAGVMTFAKNLLKWHEADKFPSLLWDSKWRENMWTLKNKTFLQIGLGRTGSEIARRAKLMDLKVWGMQPKRSFHPHCHQTFSLSELHSVLPAADIVCINLPRISEYEDWFKKNELELMKEGSILAVIGSNTVVNENDLYEISQKGKFRGILFDAFFQTPIAASSPLWNIQDILITPEVAPRPKSTERQSFRIFVYNLRQYLHGNFKDMRNVVETTVPTLL